MGSPNEDLGRSLKSSALKNPTSHAHSLYDDVEEDPQSQIDLLARLRIIEQLQQFSLPRFRSSFPDDILTDILNWITLCFCPNPSSDDVAVALAIYRGQITLFIASTPNSPSTSTLNLTKNVFKTALKQVLSENSMAPLVAARLFVRMIVDIAYPRILRKIALLGNTDGDPKQTGLHFASLVKSWLFYRPEGEKSKGFVAKAGPYASNGISTTDYMIQSLWMIAERANLSTDGMAPNERFVYLNSIMTACELFVKSTFFNDLLNHHTFRITMREQDRIFLHTLLRRMSHIASYKSGAAKFAILGVPFIQTVLGETGTQAFIEDKKKGGIVFEIISECHYTSKSHPLLPSSTTRSYTWDRSPPDLLSSFLGLGPDLTGSRGRESSISGESDYIHSRGTSTTSTSSGESALHFGHAFGELRKLDEQLQLELLSSSVIADAWAPGDTVTATYHSILQLIYHLESRHIDIMGQTLGTSKPICWMCVQYIKSLEHYHAVKVEERDLEEIERRATLGRANIPLVDDGEEKIPKKWFTSRGSGKVKHNWLIPPGAPRDVIDAVFEDAQQEMERIVEEVAFDSQS
ncbi:hypothetical protein V5O48_005881 [Marasmius crinis-equi]|uniref:Uncharacterized protein n=1 Tax=Marasmius crinis-equi TaxID=585013 RepID=A0ABR3FLY6_9AGAR